MSDAASHTAATAVDGRSAPRRHSRMAIAGIVWLFLAALAVSAIYPIVFLVATSLRTTKDYVQDPGGIPGSLTLDNLSAAIHELHIGQLALNSLMVVVPAVILVTIISCLAAYALTHFEFPFRRTTFVAIVALLALPPTVLLIPVFKVVLDAGLLNERLGLILVYVALSLPFSVYLLASFMRSIPGDLLTAAQIDGAGPLRILWSIVVPLVKPGLLTLVTLNFLILWNELLFSLVLLQKESLRTIMVGLSQYQAHVQKSFGAISVGLLLSIVPPLIIFVFFQRSLARGLTAGAVK